MIQKNDPRLPGGIYWSGYWCEDYEVLAIWSSLRNRQVWMETLWRGQVTTVHCTPWDGRRDKILAAP